MRSTQGLTFLALVPNTARGGPEQRAFANISSRIAAVFFLSLLSTSAQEQLPDAGTPPQEIKLSLSAERLNQIRVLPSDEPFLTYKVREQLLDNFDERSLEFYVIRAHLRNDDYEERNAMFARSTKRRVERSVTRTAVRAFENTAFMSHLRDGAWRERLFQVVKDSIVEDTPTIGTPIGEEDPKVDYDVETPIVQKPAWRDALSVFIRPWSLHPNAGIGFKLDGIRAQIKAHHDQVKISASTPITDDWTLYASARMKEYSPEDTSFSLGFQHTIRCFPGMPPALLQYGVSVKNRSFFQGGESHREFRPNGFLHFVFDY